MRQRGGGGGLLPQFLSGVCLVSVSVREVVPPHSGRDLNLRECVSAHLDGRVQPPRGQQAAATGHRVGADKVHDAAGNDQRRPTLCVDAIFNGRGEELSHALEIARGLLPLGVQKHLFLEVAKQRLHDLHL